MSNATHVAKIEETVARQRAFFQTGATRPVAVRVAALKRLKKEIQDYVKHRTAPYKYPRIVVFRDELPKTTSGKIQRSKL